MESGGVGGPGGSQRRQVSHEPSSKPRVGKMGAKDVTSSDGGDMKDKISDKVGGQDDSEFESVSLEDRAVTPEAEAAEGLATMKKSTSLISQYGIRLGEMHGQLEEVKKALSSGENVDLKNLQETLVDINIELVGLNEGIEEACIEFARHKEGGVVPEEVMKSQVETKDIVLGLVRDSYEDVCKITSTLLVKLHGIKKEVAVQVKERFVEVLSSESVYSVDQESGEDIRARSEEFISALSDNRVAGLEEALKKDNITPEKLKKAVRVLNDSVMPQFKLRKFEVAAIKLTEGGDEFLKSYNEKLGKIKGRLYALDKKASKLLGEAAGGAEDVIDESDALGVDSELLVSGKGLSLEQKEKAKSIIKTIGLVFGILLGVMATGPLMLGLLHPKVRGRIKEWVQPPNLDDYVQLD